MEPQIQSTEGAGKTMKIVIAIIVLVIVAFLIWWWRAEAPTAPAPTAAEDTSGAIMQDLEGIDIGNIDQELESINTDLNSL